jgi:hypothetical protein
LSDELGEQAFPVVIATESSGHAMGVYSPSQPSPRLSAEAGAIGLCLGYRNGK